MAVTDLITMDNLSTKLPQWSPDAANHLYAIVDMGRYVVYQEIHHHYLCC